MKIHKGCSEHEILVYLIVRPHPEHTFRYGTEHRIRFRGYGYRSTGIQVALVDYPDPSHCIIHRIVRSFRQSNSSSHHSYRTLRHIHRTKRYFGTGGRLIPSFEIEFILIRVLFRLRLCKGIERVEAIFIRKFFVIQCLSQIFAEWFDSREIYQSLILLYRTAVGSRIVDKVEHSVGIHVLIVVHSIQSEDLQQRNALFVPFSEISGLYSVLIGLI